MFNLSPAAAAEIRHATSRSDAAGLGLRIAARQEADGGVCVGMGFDEMREGDLPLQIDGVELLIAPPSQPLLADAMLDFVELAPGEFRFVVVNPDPDAFAPDQAGGNGV
ncbi:MAG: hypothetical protein OEU93_00800 [Rubrivivax sp.]|nr:hypothetical protein [Rubrivivax sp.]